MEEEERSRHMENVRKSDHMMNFYAVSRWTWKWTKKIFFHLLDLAILNSTIILASCGSKLSYRQFRLSLVRDSIQEGRRVPQSQTARRRRQAPSMSQLKDLTQVITDTGSCSVRDFGAFCVLQKTKK